MDGSHHFTRQHSHFIKTLLLNITQPFVKTTSDYTPNSNLLARVTGPIHTAINSYEPTRDVLDTKQNKVGTSVISSYDYAVNAIGQRTGVATSGTAYPALPSWFWTYDTLGQVASADRQQAQESAIRNANSAPHTTRSI